MEGEEQAIWILLTVLFILIGAAWIRGMWLGERDP